MVTRPVVADVVHRAANEIACAREAPSENLPGVPAHSHLAGPEHFKREHGGIEQVPQLMRQEPEPLCASRRFSIESGLIAFPAVLSDGARDGVVQTLVEGAKVFRADGYVQFHRQFREGLADIAVIVHHL